MRRSQRATSDGGRGQPVVGEGRGHHAAGGGLAGMPTEILLVLIGGLVYLNSFAGQFLFDDHRTILQGRLVSTRPVVSGSILLNRVLAGTWNRSVGPQDVWGFHLFNLAVHVVAGLALLGAARRALRHLYPSEPARCEGLALAISLLWLVHPLQTQAVTYVIQRSTSMMAMFYLAGLYCAIRAAEAMPSVVGAGLRHAGVSGSARGSGAAQPSRAYLGWQIAAIAAFALGVGCKSVMATFPVIVLLYDRCFHTRSLASTLRRFGVSVGIMAAICAAMLLSVGLPQRLLGVGGYRSQSIGFNMPDIQPLDYLKTQPQVILHYLKLTFWPAAQSLDYGWPVATDKVEIVMSGLAVLGLLAAGIALLRRRPGVGFLIVSFFVILAPESSIVPIRDLCVEHRMYLPLACVVGLTVCGAERLLRVCVSQGWMRSEGRHLIPITLLAAATIALGWRTIRRNADYHNEIGMWRAVTRTHPDNPRGWWGKGAFLKNEALRLENQPEQERRRKELLLEAVGAFDEAIHRRPNAPSYHSDRGTALAGLGRLDEAIASHRAAIDLHPDYAEAYSNMGHALLQQFRLDDAIAALDKAIEIAPHMPEAYNNLSRAYVGKHEQNASMAGRADVAKEYLEKAIQLSRKAIEIKPDFADAHMNLAILLAVSGQGREAGVHYQEALRLKPELATSRAAQSLIAESAKPKPENVVPPG